MYIIVTFYLFYEIIFFTDYVIAIRPRICPRNSNLSCPPPNHFSPPPLYCILLYIGILLFITFNSS